MAGIQERTRSIKTWHGFLFKDVDFFCFNFKSFFYYHEDLFEIFFLFTYLIEQISLLYLFYFGNFNIQGVVGLFTLLFLFTLSFEKILLKMRNRKLAEEKTKMERDFYNQIINIEKESKSITEQYQLSLEKYNKLKSKRK